MTDIERIVRIFHESRDLRDPERGVAVIAPDCRFEDVARGEAQIGPGYIPHFVTAELDDGPVQALAFLPDHAVDEIRPDLSRAEQIRYIAGRVPPHQPELSGRHRRSFRTYRHRRRSLHQPAMRGRRLHRQAGRTTAFQELIDDISRHLKQVLGVRGRNLISANAATGGLQPGSFGCRAKRHRLGGEPARTRVAGSVAPFEIPLKLHARDGPRRAA